MERMRGQGGVYGGVFFLFRGGEFNDEKIYKNKYDEGLRWPPFDILHATTNQKLGATNARGVGRERRGNLRGGCMSKLCVQ